MSKTKSGGSKKMGRNLMKCKHYKITGRRERNKRRRLLKHMEKYTEDKQAKKALKLLR